MAERNLTDRLLAGPFFIVGAAMYICGAAMFLGGLGFALYQCWLWLRDGYWTSFTIRYALGEPPRSTWAGLAQIIEWIWRQPLAAGLIVASFFAIWASGVIYGIGDDAKRRTR
jgi:hypothetical protein